MHARENYAHIVCIAQMMQTDLFLCSVYFEYDTLKKKILVIIIKRSITEIHNNNAQFIGLIWNII